jgi:hypothetical protein
MASLADRCKETTTTTGTGALTLAGAAAQFQSFATAYASAAALVQYAIVGQGTTEWEVGDGTFNGTTGLTRDLVRSSSNSNALVSFSSGTKDVFVTIAADLVESSGPGQMLAQSLIWAMP